jgi:hypothetical protein
MEAELLFLALYCHHDYRRADPGRSRGAGSLAVHAGPFGPRTTTKRLSLCIRWLSRCLKDIPLSMTDIHEWFLEVFP